MKKRIFEILDEMNQLDTENKTRLLAVSNNLISAAKTREGARIIMGMDDQSLWDISEDDAFPILLIVNKRKYKELTKAVERSDSKSRVG